MKGQPVSFSALVPHLAYKPYSIYVSTSLKSLYITRPDVDCMSGLLIPATDNATLRDAFCIPVLDRHGFCTHLVVVTVYCSGFLHLVDLRQYPKLRFSRWLLFASEGAYDIHRLLTTGSYSPHLRSFLRDTDDKFLWMDTSSDVAACRNGSHLWLCGAAFGATALFHFDLETLQLVEDVYIPMWRGHDSETRFSLVPIENGGCLAIFSLQQDLCFVALYSGSRYYARLQRTSARDFCALDEKGQLYIFGYYTIPPDSYVARVTSDKIFTKLLTPFPEFYARRSTDLRNTIWSHADEFTHFGHIRLWSNPFSSAYLRAADVGCVLLQWDASSSAMNFLDLDNGRVISKSVWVDKYSGTTWGCAFPRVRAIAADGAALAPPRDWSMYRP